MESLSKAVVKKTRLLPPPGLPVRHASARFDGDDPREEPRVGPIAEQDRRDVEDLLYVPVERWQHGALLVKEKRKPQMRTSYFPMAEDSQTSPDDSQTTPRLRTRQMHTHV